MGRRRVCRDRRQHVFGHKRASDFAKLATNELDKVWYGMVWYGMVILL